MGDGVDVVERCVDGTGRGIAAFYVNLIKHKRGDERTRAAENFNSYLNGEFRDESIEFQQEFVAYMDSTSDQHGYSAVYECINSNDPEDRKAGTILIALLADANLTNEGNRAVRFAHYLLKVLLSLDESGMESAARGLAYLIQTSKTYAAELVEKCLDQALEWAEEDFRHHQRRLAAAILLRELALFTSTAFFLRANTFFRNIFRVMRDQKVHIRIAAASALHAALTVTSQREAKQKAEWYLNCYNESLSGGEGLGKEEKLHCMLLVFNELLRIADSKTEGERLGAIESDAPRRVSTSGHSNAMQFLTTERFASIKVESRTAKQLITTHFEQMLEKTLDARTCRQPQVVVTFLEVLPRLSPWMEKPQLQACVDLLLPLLPRSPHAQLAAALFVIQKPVEMKSYLPKLLEFVNDALSPAKKKNLGDSQVFVLLRFIVRAYGEDVHSQMRDILPVLLSTGLSTGLTRVLHEVYDRIESLRMDVLDGLMEHLAIVLMGSQLPSKIGPPVRPSAPKGPITVQNVALCVLALDTLGEFEFQRHSLQMFMQYIADGYLISESVDIRLAAVRCCTSTLRPFIRVYEGVHREHREWVLSLIHGVLRCLVSVSVVDASVVVRLHVMHELQGADKPMLSHLAQPEILELLLMCLRDEKLEMQEAVVVLLGKLAFINPALVLPRLRRIILETIGQLMNSGEGRLEQHSARIIATMARENPKFMRPYMGSLLAALMPKLRHEQKFADVTVNVLKAMCELAVVGGSEVVRSIDVLFPKLMAFISDSSSYLRRETALKAIGHLCASTAYVVDPYKDYPSLLDDLLRLMKTEMSQSMRRQTMKVLGVLGALDPYTHKVFLGSVHSATSISAALSLPTNRTVTDPRADIVQWFNYEKCTLDEFYPSITIANLMLMVQDDAYTPLYAEITQDLLTIFRSLGDRFPQFVQQVIPRLLEVARSCRKEHRDFFLRQLASLLATIQSHSKPYLNEVFQLYADAWVEEVSLRATVVEALETIGRSLSTHFSPYIAEVIPYLLEAMKDRTPDRKLTCQALNCITALSSCLSSHLHLILPPILSLIDDSSANIAPRLTAIHTLHHVAGVDDISDYAPRIIQTWTRAVAVPQLMPPAMNLMKLILSQRWKHFDLFHRTMEITMQAHNINTQDYSKYLRSSGNPAPQMKPGTGISDDKMVLGGRTQPAAVPRPMHPVSVARSQKVNVDVVRRAWTVTSLVSKDDWSQWLIKLRLAFIKAGSSSAIRAVASLSDQHHQLARDLFNAAFMSVWTELHEEHQNDLTRNLLLALETSHHPDVIQTILNLAEFMDHSEKGPLPVDYAKLGKSAEDTKAYAKALRYKELQIAECRRMGQDISLDNAHSLITFANKLNVQEEAAGVIKYAERTHGDQISVLRRSRWYEKLNDWEKALELVQQITPAEARKEGVDKVTEHEMKCLEALSRWTDLNEKVKKELNTTDKKMDPKIAIMAARGAWATGDWDMMRQYVEPINVNSQDGSFLRAVLAVKYDNFTDANMYIEKCRDMHDAELSAMASESYERAYGAMVLVQQLAELEEAMEYKLRPERRARIALLWSRRLQGCRQNVEQWQKLLMLRSLVLSPSEMHPLRVKFSSLCRKNNKLSMCRAELRSLLSLLPGAPLHAATPPLDRPQLVIALCKQLWKDDLEGAAVATLDGLGRHLDRMPMATHNSETRRLIAKTFLKLGEWAEAKAGTGAFAHVQFRPTLPAHSALNTMDGGPQLSPRLTPPPLHHNIRLQPGTSNGEQVSKIIRHFQKATEMDPSWQKAWHRLATAYFNAVSHEKEKRANPPQQADPPGHNISFLNPPSSRSHISEYSIEAVKAFAKSLQLTEGSRLEDTLRFLALWFDQGDKEDILRELREIIKALPIQVWLEVIPQLIARLDTNSNNASVIKQVVVDVGKQYPQALVYALTVAAKSPNVERAKNAKEVLILLNDIHSTLVNEAKVVSDELVRCAILWLEQWHEVLDDASRMYFQEKNIKGMLEALEPMHQMMETAHRNGGLTLKETSFQQTHGTDLADARKFCIAFQRTSNGKELTQAWEIYYSVFKRISAQLRQMTSLDLNYISPVLMQCKDMHLAVPGTFDPSAPLVTISSFGPHLQVISSKQRPRKLIIRGSDGSEYAFLLKGHEDPRQDERVMQLFALVNNLLVHNNDTCRRNLTIQRYSIVALSQNSGLIGWVPDCDTLHSLVRDYRDKKKMALSLEHNAIRNMAPDTEQLTVLQKVQLFEKALQTTKGDDLQQILWLKSPNSEAWFDRRTNYTRSMACMSMVGYMLGLGDRHPSNLMLDRLSGKIIHIDFGDCFEVAMTREKFPEKIPFRLTRMLVNAMEITGIEGNYRMTCERVLRVLRANKDSLLAVLEAFVYDPLINWRLLDVNKRNPGEKTDYSKVKMVPEIPESVSRRVIDRIKLKLTGREFDSQELHISEHVERLIEQATIHDNLSQCYVGWCPFW